MFDDVLKTDRSDLRASKRFAVPNLWSPDFIHKQHERTYFFDFNDLLPAMLCLVYYFAMGAHMATTWTLGIFHHGSKFSVSPGTPLAS